VVLAVAVLEYARWPLRLPVLLLWLVCWSGTSGACCAEVWALPEPPVEIGYYYQPVFWLPSESQSPVFQQQGFVIMNG